MSEPKYISSLSKRLKAVKKVSLGLMVGSLIVWFARVVIWTPSNPILIFIFPELYVFLASLTIHAYLRIKAWKFKIYSAEGDIFETIAYRDKTSIKNLAAIKDVSEKEVVKILTRFIKQEKLDGFIKDGLFISEHPMVPMCALCNKEISDKLLMVLCPYCKRTFHKDHLIDYINEKEEKCPKCEHELQLEDIVK